MNWFEVNLKDLNSIAIFAARGQWAGAFASLLAVIVAVGIAIWSGRQAQKQSRQSRYDSARPVLVVSSEYDDGALIPPSTQAGLPGWIDWNNPKQNIFIKNVGSGVAFNIMSVLYGPSSLVKDRQSIPAQDNEHWTWMMSNLSIGEEKMCLHDRGGSIFFECNRQIEGYSFLAPAQPLHNPDDHEPTYICRVVVTYHDIFKRKHASIFDCNLDGNWTMRTVLEDIRYDLRDLKGLKQPPRPSFLKRLKKGK